MWTMFDDRLRETIRADRALSKRLPDIEKEVATGTLSPAVAVDEISPGARAEAAMIDVLITGFGPFPACRATRAGQSQRGSQNCAARRSIIISRAVAPVSDELRRGRP